MAIHTIRETLTGDLSFDLVNEPPVPSAPDGSWALIQKKINLPHGQRHTIQSIDCFDDNTGLFISSGGTILRARQLFVTPFPVVLSKESWGINEEMTEKLNRSGPLAGDDLCLYQRTDWTILNDISELQSNKIWTQQFPNPESANNIPFVWYTDTIYLTCLVYAEDGLKYAPNGEYYEGGLKFPISVSFYLRVNSVKCSALEYGIGVYKELLEAQVRTLLDTANNINPSDSAAGRSFPSWKFGGIRPELMLTSAEAVRYYNRVATNANQDMQSVSDFRSAYKKGTSMVGYDEAWGTEEFPQWITIFNVQGVTSGSIRPLPPPTKYTGSGNTVMYDEAGNPASIVT